MKLGNNGLRLASIASCIASMAYAGTTVFAADAVKEAAAAPQDSGIEEVIVTARRREENLQEVPISVTAIGGESLSKMGVANAIDLSFHVPNLMISPTGSDITTFSVGVRGQRNKSTALTDDPPVGTVYAESVLPHPYGFGDMFDIRSVQVLKGPQGTLFGRNTTGGVVVIEPNRASIDEGVGGNAKLTLGNYNLRQFDGVLNVPLNDVAAVRVAAEHKERDGYTTDILTGKKWDAVHNDALRASLLLKPTRDITSHTTVDYLDVDDSPPSSQRLGGVYPGGGLLLGGFAQANRLLAEQRARNFYDFASYTGSNGPLDLLAPYRCRNNPASPFQTVCRDKSQPEARVWAKGLINNTQVDFDGFSIKNILGYRDGSQVFNSSASWNNASTGPISGVGNVAIQQHRFTDYSDEIQISGKSLDKRLDWVAGYIWMREIGADRAVSFQGIGAAVPVVEFIQPDTLTNEAQGVYAQGTYALTERLKGTLGFRRNFDKREAHIISNYGLNVVTGVRTCAIFNGSTSAVLPIGQCGLEGSANWAANTWTASLDYQLTEHTMIYGTSSKGYKSGGFFYRATRANVFKYDPEFVRNYETGVKSDWTLMGRPIRTDLSIYRMDFSNQQVNINNTLVVPVAGYVGNVGKSRYQGVEFELTYKPTQQLELSGFLSYADAKYLSYTDPGTGADLTFETTAQPLTHWIAGLSAAYNLPLQDNMGTLDFRADVSARSKVIAPNVKPLVFSEYPQPGFVLMNLRVDWSHPMGSPVDLGFFVTNVTDSKVASGSAGASGFSMIGVMPPRMFGVELSYKFGEGFKPKE